MAAFAAAGHICGCQFFGGLSALPVTCPYRAEQATGFAGGYDYAQIAMTELCQIEVTVPIQVRRIPSALLCYVRFMSKYSELPNEG